MDPKKTKVIADWIVLKDKTKDSRGYAKDVYGCF